MFAPNVVYPKRKKPIRYYLQWIHKNLYEKYWIFFIIMTLYHIVVITYTIFNIPHSQFKVFVVLDSLDAGNSMDTVSMSFFKAGLMNITMSLITILIDTLFFWILLYELPAMCKKYWINWGTVAILEIIIFALSMSHPSTRLVLWFLSINTFQVIVPYELMKRIPMINYVFITGSIYNLIVLTMSPLIPILAPTINYLITGVPQK